MVVFWVTQMYHRVTWKYDKLVMKKKGDWFVLCMGCWFPVEMWILGNPDVQSLSHSKFEQLDCPCTISEVLHHRSWCELNGYVIPLSIESGLVYMHSIRIPTDSDLKQYPHVFFTSPNTWDASVLDHGITPSYLRKSTKNMMIPYFRIPSLMNLANFNTGWYNN